jgi:signal transduction histidine kinase
MRIQDDGQGFDLAEVDGSQHLGLQTMAERVKWLGGTFDIQSRPGEGTAVTITIPYSGPRGQTSEWDADG